MRRKRMTGFRLAMAVILWVGAGCSRPPEVKVEKMGGGTILTLGKIRIEIGRSYIMSIAYDERPFITKVYYHVIDSKWADVGSQLSPLSTEPVDVQDVSGGAVVTLQGVMGSEENGQYGYVEKITFTNDGKLTIVYEPIESILDKGKVSNLQLGTMLDVATYRDKDISLLVGAKITSSEGREKREDVRGREITEEFGGLYDDPVTMRFPFEGRHWNVHVQEGIWRVNNFTADWVYEIQFVPRGLDKTTAVVYDLSEFLK